MQMKRNALYSGLIFSPNLLSECLTHSQSNRRDRQTLTAGTFTLNHRCVE